MNRQKEPKLCKLIVPIVFGAIAFVGICLCIAFLSQEQHIQRWMLFGTFFFGFVSFTVSMIAVIFSAKSYVNVEREKNKRIYKEAESFIEQFENEIDLLPLCVIANAYNSTHHYEKEIYNSFNRLDEQVKIEIIRQQNTNYELIENIHWFDQSLNVIREFINKYDLGHDVLYDNAKHYKYAFKLGAIEYSFKDEYAHVFPDYSPLKKYTFKGDKTYVDNVSFFDYLKQYVRYKVSNDLFLASYKVKPIDYYCHLIDFQNCEQENASFATLNIVDSVAHIIMEKHNKGNENVKHLPVETTNITNYEDRFLESLTVLYDLSKYKLGSDL